MSRAGNPRREEWSSERMFLMAVIGGAVGLGNIWRFPYVVGENGGGAFLVLYVFFVLLASLPLKIAEVAVGKSGRGSPVESFVSLAREEGASSRWGVVGWMMIGSALLVLTFYPVIGGWSLSYVLVALSGGLAGLDGAAANALFSEVNENPWSVGRWHFLFLALTVWIVAGGVRSGLERIFKIAVPGLMLILILLVLRAVTVGDAPAALRFLFHFDRSAFTLDVALMALGQSFFSLGVGTGIFMTYGSYAPAGVSVSRTMLVVGAVDTSVSVLAGLAIFPFVFGFGLAPSSGPSLFFLTLPIAFGSMPLGSFVGALFFLLIFLAAISSSIGMLECSISRFKEKFPGRTARIAIVVGAAVWLCGIPSVLSENVWKELEPLSFIGVYQGRNFLEIFDFTLSNVLLPLNGILLAVFVGWVIGRSSATRHVDFERPSWFRFWRFQLRYTIPVALGTIMFFGLRQG